MATARFAWGIDVGNRALKAVKLVRDGAGGLRVDDIDIIEHEHLLSDAGDNKESLIAQSLATFAQKHPEKGGAVAIGVSGQSSFARFIKLPPVEDKKLPEIVRFEAIQQIPFPLDDVEWSYQLFQDENSPEKEVGIFAMRKELVNEHISKFTSAGLNVQVVQMNPLAVYNAMRYDDRIKGTTMVVDVGAENTDLIIAEGEQVWLRSIPVGGNNFTEALTKQFKLKFPKAEELKRNAATSKYTRQILQAMRPVFDSLVAEIQRSIGFYASVHRDARISRVIALGGTFRLPGLMKFLQMQLQLDVQRFDSLGAAPPSDGRVATLLNDNVLSIVGAYGLALQAMGEGKIVSSLLPLAIRKERMWKEKTKWFAAAAALVVLGTGIAFARAMIDTGKQEAAEASQRPEIEDQLRIAQKYSDDWKQIEDSGAPERTVIASLQSLTRLRDVQGEILIAIDKALPEPTPKPDTKVPRTDRQVVLINELVSQYFDDVSPGVAKANGEFVMLPTEFRQYRSGPISASSSGLRQMVKTMAAARVGAAAAPADAPPAGTDGTTGKLRGYVITLTCTTPMARSQTVAENVRQALIDQTKPTGDPKERQPFRIERVEIVDRTELKSVPRTPVRPRPPDERKQRLYQEKQQQEAAERNRAIGAGASGDLETNGFVARRFPQGNVRNALGGPRGGAGGRPLPPRRTDPGAVDDVTGEAAPDELPEWQMPPLELTQQQASADPNAPRTLLDPVTGEDASKDWRLTLLIAVVLDPPPPPAPPAPPTDGEQPAEPGPDSVAQVNR